MDFDELDESVVRENMDKLETFDLKTATIPEVEEVVRQLLNGYKMTVEEWLPPLYLYRARICNVEKPTLLKHISYPPEEFVTGYGRANDIGKSLFYGSISKNTPLYEIGAKPGDKVVFSTWKTNTKIVLNHVGYSKEVFESLKSIRAVNTTHKLADLMQEHGELNTSVYNYLGSIFSKRIGDAESYMYKVSIAIANILTSGDDLHGLVYPTIAMNANSDNVAILPSYIDDHVDLVAAEYVEVIEKNGEDYRIRTLDTATEVDDEGKLVWTSRYLKWTISNPTEVKAENKGNDWIIRDATQTRIDPIPGELIGSNISDLKEQYLNAFATTHQVPFDMPMSDSNHSIIVSSALHLDTINSIRFCSFYIPTFPNVASAIPVLLPAVDTVIELDKIANFEMKIQTEGQPDTSSKDFPFTKEVYIYTESPLDPASVAPFRDWKIHIVNAS